jgi:TPP-dependent pyruvate/acetoin dehydrogenase alpha subunit
MKPKSSSNFLLGLHQAMVRSRTYEEALQRVYMEGKTPVFNIAAGPIPGELHLSIGHEPVAAGVCAHLRPSDSLVGTHRSHHLALAKGVDMKRLTAEIFGKATGLSKGKGGHMHLFAPEVGFCTTSIIGEGMPTGVGHALVFKKRGVDNVAVVAFGDGAANQGALHEALNLAAIWQLPVVFVCEDNGWASTTAKRRTTAGKHNSDRAHAFGISGTHIPDNDVEAIFEIAGEAVARARGGGGPSFIEIETQRICGHFEPDTQPYRPADEVRDVKENDALKKFERKIIQNGLISESGAKEVWKQAASEVEEAIAFARSSPFPKPEEALEHVFAA